YEVGYPDTPMDALGDRGRAAMDRWRAREDDWMARLGDVDAPSLEGTDGAIPWAFTRDRLTASAGRRVCRTELWNVSPTWTGWQSMLGSTFSQQPVATPRERAVALTRLGAVPGYLDTEVDNLRAGTAQGYLASRSSVDAVLRQVDALLAAPPEGSPFYDPARRADDADFAADVRHLVVDRIRPAMERYRAYLADEYRGRAEVGVSANPDGPACYAASVRFHTSLDMDARAIHETGLREMARIQGEMLRIARESFGTDDVKGLLQRLRTDRRYTFGSEAEVLAYAQAAVDRGAVAVHDWFGFVPDAKVVVKPFPAYQHASGGGFYSAGSQDGTRPGTYELGTWDPTGISKAGMEATAFHETWPGHHLQMSVALFGDGVHPVLRYVYVASVAEGWGLYSERLADEMGLYSGALDRLGMLSNEALRAARLVVDPGMHVLGWSRELAIQYMLDHTAESRNSVESEIDRYIAVPGQATAYLLGSLEIQRLRRDAAARLGDRFDIEGFHDVVLGDGAVSLPMLRAAVDRWVASR
ncbi:MAG TPA: DUF885 domain-containing protein, partial [Longimicrobiales bacterium]|nr:DUF885 domain-containing protein [Longimicrobiales bacterium]